MTALEEKKVLFLDIQTSGGSPKLSSIVEMAWAVGSCKEGFCLDSSFVSLREDDSLSRRVSKLTGIKSEQLEESPSLKEVLAKIKEIVLANFSSDEQIATVIHYAQFERSFLSLHDLGFEIDILCTHKLSGHLWPDLPSKSLRAVSGFLGFESEELKRSRHHIDASIHIWKDVVEKLSSWDEAKELLLKKKQKTDKKQFLIDSKKRLSLPDSPGVYKYMSKQASVLYIGKASSLKSRVNSYFRGRKTKGSRLNELLSRAVDIEYISTETPLEAALLEQRLIKEIDPPYNRALRAASREVRFYDKLLNRQLEGNYNFGPFGSSMRVNNFINLLHSIELENFEYWKRFGEIDTDLLCEAIEEWKSYFDFSSIQDVFSSVALRLYRDRVDYWREHAELEDSSEDLEEDEQSEDDVEAELTKEDIIFHIDRVFSSMVLNEKRARKIRALTNCVLLWKESKSQKGFHGIRFAGAKMEKFFVARRPKSFPYKSSSKSEFIENFNIEMYDEASVLDLEIQRLQRKGFDHYLYFGSKVWDKKSILRYFYPKKAAKGGLI